MKICEFSKILESIETINVSFSISYNVDYWSWKMDMTEKWCSIFEKLNFWKIMRIVPIQDGQIFRNWKHVFVKHMKKDEWRSSFKKSRVLRTPFLLDVRAGCFRYFLFSNYFSWFFYFKLHGITLRAFPLVTRLTVHWRPQVYFFGTKMKIYWKLWIRFSIWIKTQ